MKRLIQKLVMASVLLADGLFGLNIMYAMQRSASLQSLHETLQLKLGTLPPHRQDYIRNYICELVEISLCDDAIHILGSGSDTVSRETVNGEMLLSSAAIVGDRNVARLLLTTSIDPDKASIDGKVPLHYAVESGHEDVVDVLLSAGVDRNRSNRNGETPLYCASKGNCRAIVRRLLSAGADKNALNISGETPLYRAVSDNNYQIGEELLLANVDKDRAEHTGIAPLARAVLDSNIQMIKLLLLARANKNLLFPADEKTLLLKAVQLESFGAVQLLLAAGVDPDVHDREGITPLSLAASLGNTEIVKLLLLAGADKNKCDRYGRTPLQIALNRDYDAIIKLLYKGDRVNLPSLYNAALNGLNEIVDLHLASDDFKDEFAMNGENSLFAAVRNNHKHIVEMLIKKGVAVNVRRVDGLTPLFVAAEKGFTAVAGLLLEAGADKEMLYHGKSLIAATEKNRLQAMKASVDGYHALLGLISPQENNHLADLFVEVGAREAAIDDSLNILQVASQNGHAGVVELLLKADVDGDMTNNNGSTSLSSAAAAGHAEVVSLLMSAGVNKNMADNDGATALYHAARNGHASIVRALLASGADKEASFRLFEMQESPLIAAARNGHAEVVDVLLADGAKRDITMAGLTCLHIAALNGYARLVTSFLSVGLDKDKADEVAQASPLDLAIIASGFSKKGSVRSYLTFYPISMVYCLFLKDSVSTSAYSRAEVVNLLLEAGVEKDMISSSAFDCSMTGMTPLCLAAMSGDAEVVNALLLAGADINKTASSGMTPMCWAAEYGHAEIVELLLNANSEFYSEWNVLANPLCNAISGGCDARVVNLLLPAGIEREGHFGGTPLCSASRRGRSEIVKLLLEAGAKQDTAARNGDIPLCLAATGSAVESAASSVRAATSAAFVARFFPDSNYIATVEALLAAGADINKTNHDANTPLCCAAGAGQLEIVDVLLKAHADIRIATPLCNAARGGNVGVVTLLLEAGADINGADGRGYTPLSWAAGNGHTEIVTILLAAGADKELTNATGYTPLTYADRAGHAEIVSLLLQVGAHDTRSSSYSTTYDHDSPGLPCRGAPAVSPSAAPMASAASAAAPAASAAAPAASAPPGYYQHSPVYGQPEPRPVFV